MPREQGARLCLLELETIGQLHFVYASFHLRGACVVLGVRIFHSWKTYSSFESVSVRVVLKRGAVSRAVRLAPRPLKNE